MAAKESTSGAQVRFVVLIVIGVAAIILALQNLDPVTTKFLMFEVSLPRAIWLMLTAVAGFIAGVLVAGRGRKR